MAMISSNEYVNPAQRHSTFLCASPLMQAAVVPASIANERILWPMVALLSMFSIANCIEVNAGDREVPKPGRIFSLAEQLPCVVTVLFDGQRERRVDATAFYDASTGSLAVAISNVQLVTGSFSFRRVRLNVNAIDNTSRERETTVAEILLKRGGRCFTGMLITISSKSEEWKRFIRHLEQAVKAVEFTKAFGRVKGHAHYQTLVLKVDLLDVDKK